MALGLESSTWAAPNGRPDLNAFGYPMPGYVAPSTPPPDTNPYSINWTEVGHELGWDGSTIASVMRMNPDDAIARIQAEREHRRIAGDTLQARNEGIGTISEFQRMIDEIRSGIAGDEGRAQIRADLVNRMTGQSPSVTAAERGAGRNALSQSFARNLATIRQGPASRGFVNTGDATSNEALLRTSTDANAVQLNAYYDELNRAAEDRARGLYDQMTSADRSYTTALADLESRAALAKSALQADLNIQPTDYFAYSELNKERERYADSLAQWEKEMALLEEQGDFTLEKLLNFALGLQGTGAYEGIKSLVA